MIEANQHHLAVCESRMRHVRCKHVWEGSPCRPRRSSYQSVLFTLVLAAPARALSIPKTRSKSHLYMGLLGNVHKRFHWSAFEDVRGYAFEICGPERLDFARKL